MPVEDLSFKLESGRENAREREREFSSMFAINYKKKKIFFKNNYIKST